jgi:hypothetical protein
MASDKLRWARLLKQVTWNKPTFVDGYLVTKFNLERKDENSFYHKDETPCLYSEWLTSIKPGVLLGKLVNPLEFISPVFVERVGTQWRVNKDETDKAIEQLSSKGLVAIHCSKEENEPIYILTEVLCEWKVFLEGQLMIPKDWPNPLPNLRSCLEQAFSFYLTEDVLFQEFCSRYPEQAETVRNYFGEIELVSPKTLRKYGLAWEKLTYSYTPETVSNETRVTRRSSLSPKEKLTTVIELMESEEMGKLVSMLRDKGLVLNPRNQFVLAVELVLGFSSTVIVEEQEE